MFTNNAKNKNDERDFINNNTVKATVSYKIKLFCVKNGSLWNMIAILVFNSESFLSVNPDDTDRQEIRSDSVLK